MVHAGHPQNQAVAAALRNAREYKAAGGPATPFGQRMAQRQITQGFLHSSVPGRTDKLPITVGGGAYVLPADHIAALGQNNSLAGAHIVNKMFGMGPFGTQASPMRAARAPQPPRLNLRRADGGGSEGGQPVPIIAAGGEMVIPPDKVIAKFGSLEKGHKALDKWVLNTRANHINTLRTLKPPKKD